MKDRAAGIDVAERLGATAMIVSAAGAVFGPSWARFARTLEAAV